MFSIKKCNKGTSFFYPTMIAKIIDYFNIGLLNLTYKYPGSSQEVSHRTLVNMNYFWDEKCYVYYLCLCKHGRKVYDFDDHIECGDDAAEASMNDEKPMGFHHDVTEGGVVIHDAPSGDDHGACFGTNYVDTASIMTMLLDMQL